MRKVYSVVAAIFLLLLSFQVHAQSKQGAEYFSGKWGVVLRGTPSGDVKMMFLLENRNDSIGGVVQDTTGAEISKITSVELADTTITLYFSAQGYDLSLVLNRKDEDHVSGSLLSMFEADGERIREMKN